MDDMQKNINVFIIILNFNGWQDTLDCVDSLKCIKGVNTQVVVVDNKSTNESVDKLKKGLLKSVVLLEAESNNGFSAGNNIGINYAMENNADFVLLLNNDTVVDNDFLTPLVNFCVENPKCGGISSRIFYFKEKNKIWFDGGSFNPYTCRAVHYRFNQEGSKIRGVNRATFLTGCCMLIPIEVVKQIGLMDERFFLYVEDTEYSLRIQKYGYELYWDADVCIYHKVGASTKKIPESTQYYEIRNRLLLGKLYLSTVQNIATKIYNIFFYQHKINNEKYTKKVIRIAEKDYKNKKYGKYEREKV